MPTFLFSADDRDGRSVTRSVEAENLAHARSILDARGFTAIEFLNSELSGELLELYGERVKGSVRKHAGLQVESYRDSRTSRLFWRTFKATWYFWPALAVLVWLGGPVVALTTGSVLVVMLGYLFAPTLVYRQMAAAARWRRHDEVRRWGRLAKILNPISRTKIPALEIDVLLGMSDAAEGDVAGGLARVERHAADPKASTRLLRFSKIRVLSSGRRYSEVRELCEQATAKGDLTIEEAVDFAIVLAVRFGETGRAREIAGDLLDRELSVWERGFVTYVLAVVETEDGNFEQAEFYLDDATAQFAPFAHNEHLDVLRLMIDFYRALVYSRTGHTEAARALALPARDYFEASGDTQMLARCDEIL